MMGFLKPLFVLIGLLIVATLLTPIIGVLAVGIFVIMIADNFSPGSFRRDVTPSDED